MVRAMNQLQIDQTKRVKAATLDVAAGIYARGGPHPGNDLEAALVELAVVTGNSDADLVAAAKTKIF
jgi:hypothetical protein